MAAGEQAAEPVTGEMPEASVDPLGRLDDTVDGFGVPIRRPRGVTVGQDRGRPPAKRPFQPGNLGYRAGREHRNHLGDQSATNRQPCSGRASWTAHSL